MQSKSFVLRLCEAFKIDERGNLIRRKYMSSNAPAGQVIEGSRHSKGYRIMGFERRTYYVHRVKFALTYGWMPLQVDHINRNRSDNRIENLRASSPQSNQENRSLSKLNRSGHTGVYFQEGKWATQLRVKWKRYHFGRYPTKAEAVQAIKKYQNAKSVFTLFPVKRDEKL